MSDKLGPIEIEFLLDKKADEQAKSLKASYDAVGTAGNKSAKQIKDAIKDQLNVIKEVEKELKELQRLYDKAAPGKNKKAAYEDLAAAQKVLSEERGILMGLQEEQIALNKKEEESANSLTGMISKWALGLGGAAAALGVLKKAFQETTAGMNAFNIIGAATKQILYDIVSGATISIERIMSAIAIQRELNALRIEDYKEYFKSAQYDAQFQQLWSDSLDQTLSRAEKLTAINDALEAHNRSIDIQVESVKKHLELTKEALKIQPDSEKLYKEFWDLNTELQNLERERVSSTKRLIRQRSALIKEDLDEQKEWRDKLHKGLQELVDDNNEMLARLKNEIKISKLDGQEKELEQLKQKYEADLEAYGANEAIKNALAEKYALDRYDIEMKYLDKVKKENEKLTADILKIDPGKGWSILNRALENSGHKPLKFFNHLDLAPTNQTQEGIDKQKEENLKREADLREKILNAASDLTYQLGQAVGLQDKELSQLGDYLNSFTQFASGDVVGGVMSMISSVIKIFPAAADKYADEIERLNGLLEEQQRLIELSERKGGKGAALSGATQLAQQKLDENEKALEKAQKKLDSPGIFGGLTWNKRWEAVQELTKAVKESKIAVEEAQQAYDDFIAGDITEKIIADAVSQGFIEGGKNGIDNIAAYMNDVLKTAAIKIFEGKILDSPQMKAYQEYITESLSDAVLTDEEKARIMQMGQDLSSALKPVWEGLTGALDFGEESADALKGAIKGITAEQASVLAGQTNAIRIAQANANNILQSSLSQLMTISANTEYLKSIDRKLDALKSNSFRAQGVI